MQIKDENKTLEHTVFSVSANADEWKKLITKTEKNLLKNLSAPGFRRGHVPPAMAKESINHNSVILHASEKMIDKLMQEFMTNDKIKNNQEILFQSAVINLDKLSDSELVIKVDFDNKPKITIEDYKNWDLGFKKSTASAEEVKKEVNGLIKKDCMLSPKEDGIIQKGNLVKFDFKGFIDDKPFAGGEAKDFELKIGSGQFIPGFEDQMIGLKKGESKSITVSFPSNYHAKEFANKKARFDLKINEVSNLTYPELDEKYIAKLNIKDVKTAEQLNKYVEKQIIEMKDANAKKAVEAKVYEHLNNAEFNFVPQNIVKNEVQREINQYKKQAEQKKIDFGKFIKDELKVSSLQELEQKETKKFQQAIKSYLAHQELIKILEIKPNTEFIDKLMNYFSQMYNKPINELAKDQNFIYYVNSIATNSALIDKLIEVNQKK